MSIGKRTIDIAGAVVGLAATSVVMGAAAAYIKLRDPGPVLFRQWRVGRDGRLFQMWKLRTMRLGAEREGVSFAHRGDNRVIPGCRWMRRCHLDELLQLWNILWGDMSLVGPRPERPEMMQLIQGQMHGFERRLTVRPGLTGLAQLRAGYTSDLRGHRRKLLYDRLYIRRMGLLIDLKLILVTLAKPWDAAAG